VVLRLPTVFLRLPTVFSRLPTVFPAPPHGQKTRGFGGVTRPPIPRFFGVLFSRV